ncbi:uncharacterized protein V6R79_005154 [Siganus canaliculatus]
MDEAAAKCQRFEMLQSSVWDESSPQKEVERLHETSDGAKKKKNPPGKTRNNDNNRLVLDSSRSQSSPSADRSCHRVLH